MSVVKWDDPEELRYCRFELPCIAPVIGNHVEESKPGRTPRSYDALPRETTFAYLPPSYYARGFRILDVYKKEFDFTEVKKLFFLEDPDPKVKAKWGDVLKQIPMPESRVIELPGTSEIAYKNYFCRSLTPESAMSWRKSIVAKKFHKRDHSLDAGGGNVNCTYLECPFKSQN